MGQNINLTSWKLTESDDYKSIMIFEKDKTFSYFNFLSQSGNTDMVYSEDNET